MYEMAGGEYEIVELSDVFGDRLRRELKITAYGERQIL
jgi:hypothetical protein